MTSPLTVVPLKGQVRAIGPVFGHEEKKRGAIFTKQTVVDFMLDLIGYDSANDLFERKLLEPSFGGGRFMFGAVDRLLESWRRQTSPHVDQLVDAIRGVELDTESFTTFKPQLRIHLIEAGLSDFETARLLDAWLINADYLWTDFEFEFDFVIGNPPYVRQELIDPEQLIAYRKAFATMVGRADLYVPFIEKSLDYLNVGGRLSFICADAWVKNDYGRGLREKVASDFHLRDYVDMYGVEAFEVGVGAYPSITVIGREADGPSRVAKAESADKRYLDQLFEALTTPEGPSRSPAVQQIERVARGSDPWLLNITHLLPIIRHMEANFPTLGEAGCRIGIGVATGNDKAFIAQFDELDVEDDRKLPLATNKDVPNGELRWSGKGILNPYTDEGPLVDLALYPRLAAHLEKYRAALELRHTAKADTTRRWYKTIDRITPSLTWQEKLLIPDIKGDGDAITYDPGTLYPHHNLYFITSSKWNLRALQAVLRSGIAQFFIEAYSVKIGGGYLRFQAQNLKRIRVPEWDDLSDEVQSELIDAGEAGRKLNTPLLERIYKLRIGDLAFLEGNN
ncbi:Eco57I restriction-modification methylase domain-containing protein [Leifsonia bigeumensis]|uniref:site-specific DNA-methyltransferase (adenine-specific) n=1 Tax=Leifsonella bigeumensis TaxID=433643 RepID=A0ABP7FA98_9MICO